MKQWSKILIKAKSLPANVYNTSSNMGKKCSANETALDAVKYVKELAEKEAEAHATRFVR